MYSATWQAPDTLVITLTSVRDRTSDDMACPAITNDDLLSNDYGSFLASVLDGTSRYSLTRVGLLSAAANEAGGLQSADLSSLVATATSSILQGSWGAHPAPALIYAVASEYGWLGAGLDKGDILHLKFDQPTNMPPVFTKADLDVLFTFSASLGSNYTGTWTSLSSVVITVTNTSGAGVDVAVGIGNLTVQVNAAAQLQSADLASPNSNSLLHVTGSWGNVPEAPTSLAAGVASHASIPLSWLGPASNNDGNTTVYKIDFTANGEVQPARLIEASPELSGLVTYVLSNLRWGTTYSDIRVAAKNYFGFGPVSNYVHNVSTLAAGEYYFDRVVRRVRNTTGAVTEIVTTVSRKGGAQVPAAVEWTANATSLAVSSGKLRFAADQTSATFSLTVDAQANGFSPFPTASIQVALLNPTGGTLLGYPSTVHISVEGDASSAIQDIYAEIDDAKDHFNFASSA